MGFSRHQSRELAVQFVYQWSLDPARAGDVTDIPKFWKEQSLSDDVNRPFFERLTKGVAGKLPIVDQAIESVLENWRFERIEKVDLAVLRVAVYEMLYLDGEEKTDAPVVINEALEVAKKFGGADSAGFVNGILDALRKKNLVGGRAKA